MSLFQEKLRRKKLLEVAPRRTSGRLEVKRHLQEEETNRWDQHGPVGGVKHVLVVELFYCFVFQCQPDFLLDFKTSRINC